MFSTLHARHDFIHVFTSSSIMSPAFVYITVTLTLLKQRKAFLLYRFRKAGFLFQVSTLTNGHW